jgi:hypothetical protein
MRSLDRRNFTARYVVSAAQTAPTGGRAAHAAAGRTEQIRELQQRCGADDRRREEKREARRILVAEPRASSMSPLSTRKPAALAGDANSARTTPLTIRFQSARKNPSSTSAVADAPAVP